MINLLNEVLVDLPDQWDALETLVQIHCDGYKKVSSIVNNDSKIEAFHNDIIRMQEVNYTARGPYLVELFYLQEIQKLLEQDDINITSSNLWFMTKKEDIVDNITTLLSDLKINDQKVTTFLEQVPSFQQEMIRLLIQYVTKFDSKQCCFTDIKRYLSSLFTSGTRSLAVEIMQTWVQEQVSTLTTELVALSTADDKEQSKVQDATILLCRISKLLQIDYYFTTTSECSTIKMSEHGNVSALQDMYANTYGLLAGKGIGGLREVQPGDELLMLCCTDKWERVCKSSEKDSEYLSKCLDWTETVILGREASPHNYCFPVESFEPLRRLACAEYAMDSFNKLEVKYIQVIALIYSQCSTR